MRLALALGALAVVSYQPTHAQAPAAVAPARPAATRATTPPKLPVRRVILYKNGVGYFEHLGKVRGNETVTVDFNSSQLNDVLKTLTTIDLGNGRVTGVSYNSEAPFAQRLGGLRLPVGEHTTLAQLLDALRGARLEVHAGTGVIVGRLLGVEQRERGRADDRTTRDELTLVSDGGEIRTVEITPAVTVRLAERDSNEQVGAYLGLLASTRAQDRRRMSIATSGSGERDLLVSYVSEVPVWKTTYRIVLPTRAGAKPILQGWAIVDNTIGEDWQNVDLSLVAGAPQSFIQQLSQPLYAQRPVVPLPKTLNVTPQTHQATLIPGAGRVYGVAVDLQGAPLPGVTVRAVEDSGRTVAQTTTNDRGEYSFPDLPDGRYQIAFDLAGFRSYRARDVAVSATGSVQQNARMETAGIAETVTVAGARAARRSDTGSVAGGVAGGIVGGLAPAPPPPAAPSRFDMADMAQQMTPAADARELGDLFEYHVSQPISIQRNESALVPILRADATADRVALWSPRNAGGRPLRAVWLTNTSDLTLDAGSFTVIDGDAFAGEGLLDAMKPHEKRLLSYAVDLGVQVEARNGDQQQTITRVTIAHGILTQQGEHRARRIYTIRNSDTTDRRVVIEHPIRPGWTLSEGTKPEESSADAYRFAVNVPTGKTETLTVAERQPLSTTHAIAEIDDRLLAIIVRDSGDSQEVRQALAPVMEKKRALAAVEADINARTAEVRRIDADQQRVRENMKALKGTKEEQQLVKRYATELNQQEDRVATLRREVDGLQQKRQAAEADLARAIEGLTLDVPVKPAP